MSPRLLLTGFEPYADQSVNPAGVIATRLHGYRCGSTEVVSATIPVVFDTLVETLTELLRHHRPSVVLSLGLYPGESLIRLEQTAVNYNDFEIPDNAGCAYRGPIELAGPPRRHSTLPLKQLHRVLLEAGIPARLSCSAGSFLCNALLYTVLGLAEHAAESPPRCAFIHLPWLPEQVAEKLAASTATRDSAHPTRDFLSDESMPSMSMDTSLRAVQLAIETVLAPNNRQSPAL